MKRKNNIRRLTVIALFCAFSYICVFLFRFKLSFLTFDIKDAVITIAAMLFGAPVGIYISFIVSLLEFLTISDTGIYGLIMNFLASAAFSFTAALIYKYRKTIKGAITGLLSGVAMMTVVMLGANLLITPLFMNTDTGTVLAMIPTLLLPFNLVKATVSASLVLILYKPISSVLKKIPGFSEQAQDTAEKYRFDKKSILVLIIGALLLCIGLFVFFFILKGNLTVIK